MVHGNDDAERNFSFSSFALLLFLLDVFIDGRQLSNKIAGESVLSLVCPPSYKNWMD